MSDENYDGAIYHVQEVDDTFEGAIYHVKVVEGSGDQHNLGYYATPEALRTAHPTANAGDFAIVGSTDTVWVWDEDSTAWVDTDTKGEVTPDMIIVKSATIPTASTTPAGAVYQYTGESNATYTHGYIYENVATTTSSSATAAQTVGSSLSDIAVDLETLESFTGWTTDNSLQIFYTGDGWSVDTTSLGVTYTGTPNVGDAITITYTAAVTTYAWTRVDVQPTPVIPDPLPSQTGNAGKFLITDGTNASWSDKPLVNNGTGTYSVGISKESVQTLGDSNINIGGYVGNANAYRNVVVGVAARTGWNNSYYSNDSVYVGWNAQSYTGNKSYMTAVGASTWVDANYATAIGCGAQAMAEGAIQLGGRGTGSQRRNSDANTFKVGNANGNYEMMSADGTIPTDRLTNAINKYSTMPTAASTNEGWIVQFTGTTDANYTHGYIYECKAQRTNPETMLGKR